MMPHFEEDPSWSIFISKFLMVNHAVILFAGYKKINFRKYLKAEIISTLIWAPLLLSVGYLFSYTALNISHEIWRFLLTVVLLVIAFVVFDRIIAWFYNIFEGLFNNGNE